jgi:DNA-binding SARP family transcriptional activator
MHLLLSTVAQAQRPDGVAVPLGARTAALLAWLAIEGPTPRGQLAALLWPENQPEVARNTLRQRLFHLRKALGADVVCGQQTLQLAPGVSHDLADGHELLADLNLDLGGEYTDWLARQRAQRSEAQLLVRQAEADHLEQASQFDAALSQAQALLSLAPLSEAAHRRVMRLHYLAGDRAAALLAFDLCARRLKDDIGVRPASETMALLATIERAEAVPARTPNPLVSVPAGLLRPPRLVGRDGAWQTLLEGWQNQALMLVSGEPGMGKTRLLSDLALRHSPVAVRVNARPGDDTVPYALMARLMRALLAQAPQELPLHQQQALARVLPELGQTSTGDGPGALALRDAFEALLAQAQQAGVAGVMLDDLHFADEASLDSLQALFGGASALAWVLAYRPAELPPSAMVLTQTALLETRALAIDLAPLGELAIAELVDSLGLGRWSGTALAPALLRHTGGNPLYLLETLKALLREGAGPNGMLPTARNVSQLIAKRLAGLSPQAIKIARCAAVAGQDFSPALAIQVLGVGPLDLADGWAELEAAQVLRDAAFAHDLIHDAALATVPPALARRLHTLIAEALAAQGAAPQRVAAHWVASDEPHKAVPCLIESGRQAARALRATEARLAYIKAAELLTDQGREGEAFQTLMAFLDQVYNPAGADVMAVLDHLDALASSAEDKARVAERRADVLARSGDFVRSGAIAVAALEALDLHQHPALAARLLCVAATSELSSGLLDAAVERMHRALEFASRSQDEGVIATTAGYFGSVLDHAHRYAEAYLGHQRAFELIRKRQAPIEIISIAANIASNRLQMGLFDTALEVVQTAYRAAGEGQVDIASQCPSLGAHHGLALRGLGDYRQALRVFEDAQVVMSQHMPAWLPGLHNMMAVMWMQLGQWARAKQAVDASLLTSASLPRYRARALILLADISKQLDSPLEKSLQREIAALTQDQSPLAQHQSGLSRVLSLPASEGYALACHMRDQGLSKQMPNHVLEAEVRCASTALRLDRHDLAAQHAREALQRLRETGPTTLYRGDVWLAAAQALEVTAPDERAQVLRTAAQWILDTAQYRVPEEFRDSFMHRNPVNRELLALAKRLIA